jgi:hypothetical protein
MRRAPDCPAYSVLLAERLRAAALTLDQQRCAHRRADRKHAGYEQYRSEMFSRLHLAPAFLVLRFLEGPAHAA